MSGLGILLGPTRRGTEGTPGGASLLQRQVFVTQNRSPNSPEARADLQAVLDSIRIER